ncbi:MAG: TetR/AcrR family transcriptional regulator [Firmicutes bacterium]|nr:TetR/AcrR family transcriptional regulator [Bacillota bacterium]MCL5065158.1 TetR/AcrR family transcriptional regulator [Bacillota bacterium]
MEQDSRTRILTVALELFDRLGYVGTSMDAIRKAAGFRTKSSLYAHFPSKESLTATLLEKILAEEAQVLTPYFKPESNASLNDVLDLAEQLTLWGLMHQTAYRFCFLQWHGDVPRLPAQDHYLEVVPRWATHVLSRIQHEGGPVRPMEPEFLVAACNGLINQVIISAHDMEPDRLTRLAHQTRELCQVIVTV